jgi:hypothetical protein
VECDVVGWGHANRGGSESGNAERESFGHDHIYRDGSDRFKMRGASE